MKVWMPYLRTGSGTDVFTEMLAQGLAGQSIESVLTPLPSYFQYAPHLLRTLPSPKDASVILANSWNGFAFARRGKPLVVVEHHCVLDPVYKPFRSRLQAIYHETIVRHCERLSLRAAQAVVAISEYTARSMRAALGGPNPEVILNAVDTDFFCPGPKQERSPHRPFRLLYVGNLTWRKGADLLPRIMERLGPDFELFCTTGLRTDNPFGHTANMRTLGRLSRHELRDAYRSADLVLFPTRFEGFGYGVAEAMACGTPVVASDCSSLPELVQHGDTGALCRVDGIDDFVGTIRMLSENPAKLTAMGTAARNVAEERFTIRRWTDQYVSLFSRLSRAPGQGH